MGGGRGKAAPRLLMHSAHAGLVRRQLRAAGLHGSSRRPGPWGTCLAW